MGWGVMLMFVTPLSFRSRYHDARFLYWLFRFVYFTLSYLIVVHMTLFCFIVVFLFAAVLAVLILPFHYLPPLSSCLLPLLCYPTSRSVHHSYPPNCIKKRRTNTPPDLRSTNRYRPPVPLSPFPTHLSAWTHTSLFPPSLQSHARR